MPMMPLSGVRISWLAIAQEARLGAVGGIGLIARPRRAPARLSVRSVTSRPTLCISRRLAGIAANQAFAPGDPSRSRARSRSSGRESRVPSGSSGRVALLEHVQA